MLYKDIFLPYINGEYDLNGNQIICYCPFCKDLGGKPSFNINLEKGLYYCSFCRVGGNAIKFLAEMEKISTKEAFAKINHFYTLDDYSNATNLPIQFLKELGLKTSTNAIEIPYFDKSNKIVATKYISNPKSKNKSYWEKGSKINIYGLWKLQDFRDNSYIILVDGEICSQVLWFYNIQALGIPENFKLKYEHMSIFERFEKIYIHDEVNLRSKNFKKDICKILPFEKLYIVKSKKIDKNCKNPFELHNKNLLDLDTLISTAEKVDKTYYDEITISNNEQENFMYEEEQAEHVKIAEEVMSCMYIKFCKEHFFVYNSRCI